MDLGPIKNKALEGIPSGTAFGVGGAVTQGAPTGQKKKSKDEVEEVEEVKEAEVGSWQPQQQLTKENQWFVS